MRLTQLNVVSSFLLALQFLTRIPITFNRVVSDKQWGQTVLFYPIVGLIIGSLIAFIAFLLVETHFTVNAALILMVWVAITGGLHLDGLADCADAWAGGLESPQRSLAIMKDPRSGAIAVVILVLLLLLKWVALSRLLIQPDFLGYLILIPALGRSAILALMLSTPYVSPQGLAKTLNAYFPKIAALIILSLSVLIGCYVIGLMELLFTGLIIYLIRRLSLQRLGGVTGDVYGATVELVEVTLLTLVIL
ncbi:MAG: adenosylcobinamide-GDP ribazoletransferase [Methylococcales bacterium]|nr:adenosylcobinamide-GDP ribazoletransferase [Methylococcales bacterium]